MTRASGTTRGIGGQQPGTSFQSETRARRARAPSSVAVRSVPPRPSVATSPSGAAPMKPGTTGMIPRASSGASARATRAVGARESGAAWPNAAVGVDEVERVDVRCARCRPASSAAATRRRAEPLAARDDVVAGARRELAQQAQALAPAPRAPRTLGDDGQDVGPVPAAGEQRARHLRVAAAQAGDQGRDGARVAASGLLRHGQERVGGPRHGGDDHDGRLGAMAADDVDGVADRGGIGQRRTAELVNVRCSAGSGHETI